MNKTRIIRLVVAFIISFVVAYIISFTLTCWGSEPVIKIGDCPSGWSTSGKYCIPGKYTKYIIEKKGECPIGYQTAGKYCMKIGK